MSTAGVAAGRQGARNGMCGPARRGALPGGPWPPTAGGCCGCCCRDAPLPGVLVGSTPTAACLRHASAPVVTRRRPLGHTHPHRGAAAAAAAASGCTLRRRHTGAHTTSCNQLPTRAPGPPDSVAVVQGAQYQKPRKIPLRIEPKTYFGECACRRRLPNLASRRGGHPRPPLPRRHPQRAALPARSRAPQPMSARSWRGWAWPPRWAQ